MRDFYPGSAGIFEDDAIISEDSRGSPKSSEDVRSLQSLRTRINASSLPVLFTPKIRDHEEGIVIYHDSFILHMVFVPYMGLS